MMLYSIGQKVILKHTGYAATIQKILGDGMIAVRLEYDDMVIPVFEDDITAATPLPFTKSIELPKAGTRDTYNIEIKTQYDIINSLGLQIAFDAVVKNDTIEKYEMYLINDTKSELLFIIKIVQNQISLLEIDNLILPLTVFHLGEMTYDVVTAMPEITIEIREVSTEGIGIPMSRTLKLKPKNFFKSIIMAPLLNKQVHHFILFDQFNTQTTPLKENKEDLKSYTNRVLTPKKTYFSSKVNSHHKNLTKNEINEYAHFNPEIDLHIENLTDKYSKMTNTEILNLQLKHYEKFMDQAYRLGVPRVFVIHGLGKGTLRDAIATRLFQDQRIERFINEYHPKYGFGATEVIF